MAAMAQAHRRVLRTESDSPERLHVRRARSLTGRRERAVSRRVESRLALACATVHQRAPRIQFNGWIGRAGDAISGRTGRSEK